jgi:hypothetical protein
MLDPYEPEDLLEILKILVRGVALWGISTTLLNLFGYALLEYLHRHHVSI